MVINHEIIIFDFSRFLFATVTFWVVKSHRGSNGPVYSIKRRASLHVTGSKGPTRGVKGYKKTGVTRHMGVMDPYTSEEHDVFKCYRVQRPTYGV